MAPPLRTAPRLVDATKRTASTPRTSSCKQSGREALGRAGARRSPPSAAALLPRFRPSRPLPGNLDLTNVTLFLTAAAFRRPLPGGAASPGSAPTRRARRPHARILGASTSPARVTAAAVTTSSGTRTASFQSSTFRARLAWFATSARLRGTWPTRQRLGRKPARICFFPDRITKW
nr:uncharacterized protein LOC127326072 isoform X1 [Lolium perenne]XP_051208886.1 uncharacterized protein LOC127326072 isoform X2 [Lolium perenne]